MVFIDLAISSISIVIIRSLLNITLVSKVTNPYRERALRV